MNKIMLIGNLTRDPELRSTPSGVTVCSFTIAVNRRFAQQGGEKQTDFCHRLVWFGRETCKARSPQCGKCPLSTLCSAFSGKNSV